MIRVPELFLSVALVVGSGTSPKADGEVPPWKRAGWSERDAAAHLLDRFTYGPRPNDLDLVIATGLEEWFVHQVDGRSPEPRLDEILGASDIHAMAGSELAVKFVSPRVFLERAPLDARVSEEPGPASRGEAMPSTTSDDDRRPIRDLVRATKNQKVLRAVHAENQLREVLVDFWFNHFNVSLTDDQVRGRVLAYERDAIRPHVLGRFEDLLEATARHPAMLLYLDNARSRAAPEATTTVDRRRYVHLRRRGRTYEIPDRTRGMGNDDPSFGLNENYARELLELHTLGSNADFSLADVRAVARAFTGWSLVPRAGRDPEIDRRLARARVVGARAGFVIDGEFLFRADQHDAGPKTVLGRRLTRGGVHQGTEVLRLLARHPSTARHLALKMARRFVSDDPPESLVRKLADIWLETDGDIRAVILALASSPEFWNPAHRGAKVKTPLELAASALRILDAEILRPERIVAWIERMGQPLYAYSAPSGFPDDASTWIQAGLMIERMNFGLHLSAGMIPGTGVPVPSGDGVGDLETVWGEWYSRLLPEREPFPSFDRLPPLLSDRCSLPSLEHVSRSNPLRPGGPAPPGCSPNPRRSGWSVQEVVGIVLGSPEFQRR